MVAGKSRFDAASARAASDKEVREELGALSLQCLLARRRLLLLSQIMRFSNEQMHVLLATRRGDRSRLPWVQLVLADMHLLFTNCGGKLDELGPPADNAVAWAAFIKAYPSQWAQLVRKLSLSSMPLDEIQKRDDLSASVGHGKSCSQCGLSFHSEKALAAHVRKKHVGTSDVSKFVGSSPFCPICAVRFGSRTRLFSPSF